MKLSPDEELFLRHWMYDEVHYAEGVGPAKQLQVRHCASPADLATLIAAAISSPAEQEAAGRVRPAAEVPGWPWREGALSARITEARASMAEAKRRAIDLSRQRTATTNIGHPTTHQDSPLLWRNLKAVLAYHCIEGQDEIETLNRLFVKAKVSLGEANGGLPHLSEDCCEIRLEQWTTTKLNAIRRKKHERNQPRNEAVPIIVVRHEGQEYMIDGQTRINRWVADGNEGPHQVIIVELQLAACDNPEAP